MNIWIVFDYCLTELDVWQKPASIKQTQDDSFFLPIFFKLEQVKRSEKWIVAIHYHFEFWTNKRLSNVCFGNWFAWIFVFSQNISIGNGIFSDSIQFEFN